VRMPASVEGMTRTRQAVLGSTAAALAACYAPALRGMVHQWSNDEDMSHGFVVPVLALWIVWRERQRWRALPAEQNPWGLAVLAAGAGMQCAAALGAGLFAGSVAFLVSVSGAVLCLGGVALLRAWAFPLLLTLFMLPKLAIVYNQATLPLQLLASRIAAGILTLAGMAVVREGNILDVAGRRLSVLEACDGMRYLLSLGFMAVVLAYLSDRKPWMRAALLAAAVPIAILANAVRVAAAGWLRWLAEGPAHAISGAFLFVLCLAALVLVERLFNKVYAHFQG
jgi:exosortase